MNRLQTLIGAGVGALALVGGAYVGYGRVYGGPMAEAKRELSRWTAATRSYEHDLEGSGAVRSRLREIAGTTLGTTEEEVAHRFRTLLHDMATTAGLTKITVTEGRTSLETNPATQVRLAGFSRDQRHSPDFWVMNGEVRGSGSLPQVAALLELSESQAWIHRVSSFVVAPTGDARDVFEVRVTVATLILPDMGPPPGTVHAVKPLEPGAETAWASIVSKNVFRMPAPPAIAPPPVVAVTPEPVHDVPAGPPPQPYFAWRLAGVMEGARGVSVVMVNDAAGQSVSVEVGQSVLDASLLRAHGEAAQFVIDGVPFEVRLGQTLADRRPADPASP